MKTLLLAIKRDGRCYNRPSLLILISDLLFVDAFKLDEAAQFRDHHSLTNGRATRQRRFVAGFCLAFVVIPDLTVSTFAVPAEIPVGDRLDRKILEAPEQAIVLRHFDALAKNFYTDQSFVRV